MSMKFQHSDIISRPQEEIYDLVKNRLEEVVPYLPNVDKIENTLREQLTEDTMKCTNVWYAKAEIPDVAKKFIKPELLSWIDDAQWSDKTHSVEYQLTSSWINDLYTAKGKNTFEDAGKNKTKVTISCDVTIYANKVPGVPRFLVKRILPHIEALIHKVLEPNMTALGKGIKEYYKNNK